MKIFLLFVFSWSLVLGQAQNKLSDRIYYGGGAGFSTSSTQTNISISPQVGYKITERYSAGVGITYQYVKIKEPINTSISNIGWSIFNRFNVTPKLFGYTEFERLTFEYFTSISPERKAKTGESSLLIGGGYVEKLSERASFNVMVLYNILYDATALIKPYNSPWVIRAGIGIGI